MRSVVLILAILVHALALQAQEPSPADIEKRFESDIRGDWISAIAGSQAFLETRAEAGSVIARWRSSSIGMTGRESFLFVVARRL